MLRPFSLVSDILVYAANIARPRMPAVPKGSARCAITGIRYNVTGDAGTVENIGGWGTLLQALTVAGRGYVQGEIPFPLISGDTLVGALPYGAPASNRFLGSHIPLPGGQALGDGVLGAGIALGPNEQVELQVERLGTGGFVDRIILDCVQFPDDENDPLNQIWNDLRFKGIGEALFIGDRIEGWQAPGAVVQFDEMPQPPAARALRRTGFRGVVMGATGLTANFEVGGAGEVTANNLLAQIWTSFQRSPQNLAAPFRSLIGLTGLEVPSGLVDMQRDERSTVSLQFAGTAAADLTTQIFVTHMFEGRDINSPTLEAANAIS